MAPPAQPSNNWTIQHSYSTVNIHIYMCIVCIVCIYHMYITCVYVYYIYGSAGPAAQNWTLPHCSFLLCVMNMIKTGMVWAVWAQKLQKMIFNRSGDSRKCLTFVLRVARGITMLGIFFWETSVANKQICAVHISRQRSVEWSHIS